MDLWAYSYRSVQRPLVRVREEIGEEAIPNPYWRFDDRYANQIGVGFHGDLPGEFKFQYGAAVLHGSALDQAHYAIYGSLFVLVSDDDPMGYAHLSAVSGQRRRAERWPALYPQRRRD